MIRLRSDFGYELWQAYHDGSGVGALDTNASLGPASNTQASNRVRVLGEVRFHELLERETLQWIRANPKKAARLFAEHVLYYWFPPAQWLPVRLARGLLTVVAAIGMWLLLARKLLIGYVLAALWIVYPMIYYVVYWSSRYRYPMDWTLVLAAAVALASPWSKYGNIGLSVSV
jgi:hypothetical protein